MVAGALVLLGSRPPRPCCCSRCLVCLSCTALSSSVLRRLVLTLTLMCRRPGSSSRSSSPCMQGIIITSIFEKSQLRNALPADGGGCVADGRGSLTPRGVLPPQTSGRPGQCVLATRLFFAALGLPFVAPRTTSSLSVW